MSKDTPDFAAIEKRLIDSGLAKTVGDARALTFAEKYGGSRRTLQSDLHFTAMADGSIVVNNCSVAKKDQES